MGCRRHHQNRKQRDFRATDAGQAIEARRTAARTKRYHADPEFKALLKSRVREAKLAFNGWSQEYYDAVFESQGGACAVCKRMWGTGEKRFAADHDHQTGRARGILCGPCNVSLGLMNDSPAALRSAAAYLERM